MTGEREPQRNRDPQVDPEPEVSAEVIRDLDARAEDADEIRGGKCRALEATTNVSGTQN